MYTSACGWDCVGMCVSVDGYGLRVCAHQPVQRDKHRIVQACTRACSFQNMHLTPRLLLSSIAWMLKRHTNAKPVCMDTHKNECRTKRGEGRGWGGRYSTTHRPFLLTFAFVVDASFFAPSCSALAACMSSYTFMCTVGWSVGT